MYFTRRFTSVRAFRFDGSRESALQIAAELPFSVARSVRHDDVLLIPSSYGFSEVRAGDWITQHSGTGALQVMTDDHFRLVHDTPSVSEP